jgi:NADH:ubiquinone oxidoreductase subunit 3 (subunit A)
MPNSYTDVYFPVLVQALIAMATAGGLLAVSFLLGKRIRNRVKDMPYESGIVPTGDARHRFSVKFYLVAMLFILFDMEAIFLYPWVVVYRELNRRDEDVSVYRDGGFCNPDSGRVLLHLEEGRSRLGYLGCSRAQTLTFEHATRNSRKPGTGGCRPGLRWRCD